VCLFCTASLAQKALCEGKQLSSTLSPVSIQTQSLALRALRKRKPQETQAANHGCQWLKISRNKRKRQPIGILGRSSGNHDWLFANASDCV